MVDFPDLEVGDSTRDSPCPKCGGGTNREKSFVVTRTEEGYVFVCHRASCGHKGATYLSRGERAATVARRDGPVVNNKPSLHKYKGDQRECPELEQYMRDRFELDTQLTLSDTGRAMFPVYSPGRRLIGWVARAYPNFYKGNIDTAAKTINYDVREYPLRMHFPTSINWFPAEHLVVVEDWVSAEKLASVGIPAAALLGTNLSFETAEELRNKLGVKQLCLLLDFDALAKAAKLSRELSLVFDAISIQVLEKDPKDTPVEELRHVFG